MNRKLYHGEGAPCCRCCADCLLPSSRWVGLSAVGGVRPLTIAFSRDHRTELPQVAPTSLHGGWLPYHPTARSLHRFRGPQHVSDRHSGVEGCREPVTLDRVTICILPGSSTPHTVAYLPARLTAAIAVLSVPFLSSFSTSADAICVSYAK